MREVTEKEFWNAVMTTDRNVHPRVEGKHPFTSVFIDQQTYAEFGREVSQIVDGKEVTRYFLTNSPT